MTTLFSFRRGREEASAVRVASEKFACTRVEEIPPGGRKLVEVAGRSIGVFNVTGTFAAALNVCPHELAPVCRGRVTGTTLASIS